MAGRLGPTGLMLVSNNIVRGHFDNYTEIGVFFGVGISDQGEILFRGHKANPSYHLKRDLEDKDGFTKAEAVHDWCRCHMMKHLGDHQIYRYLK